MVRDRGRGLAAAGMILLAVAAPAAAGDALFEEARAATREGKYKEALATYDAMLRMHGEDASVRHNRCLIYLEIGELGLARAEAKRAAELVPDEGRYRITLAVTYLMEDRPDLRRAESILRRAVRLLDKKRDYTGLASAYYNLGVIEQRRLDLVEARRLYEQALQYNPADKNVRLALDILPPTE